MITPSGLKSAIKAIFGSTQQMDALTKLANAISGYLTSNLEINGVYTGVIPSTPPTPSPFNGPHVWKVNYILTSGMILPYCRAGDQTFGLNDLSKTMFLIPTSIDGLVTLNSPIVTNSNVITNLKRTKYKTFDDAWNLLSNDIVTGFLTSMPIPTGSPAIGTDGSVGSVTLIRQS